MRLARSSAVTAINVHLTVFVVCLCILVPAAAASSVKPAAIQVRPSVSNSTARVEKQEPTPISGEPTRVRVPSAGIDVTVKTGSYDESTQTWEIDDQSAFYAETTVPVNDTNGTTLIYGHAIPIIFGALTNVNEGVAAIVTTSEHEFIYEFESKRQVEPSYTDMLQESGAPTLLLQTCSGAWDEYRTLVSFRLKEVRML